MPYASSPACRRSTAFSNPAGHAHKRPPCLPPVFLESLTPDFRRIRPGSRSPSHPLSREDPDRAPGAPLQMLRQGFLYVRAWYPQDFKTALNAGFRSGRSGARTRPQTKNKDPECCLPASFLRFPGTDPVEARGSGLSGPCCSSKPWSRTALTVLFSGAPPPDCPDPAFLRGSGPGLFRPCFFSGPGSRGCAACTARGKSAMPAW